MAMESLPTSATQLPRGGLRVVLREIVGDRLYEGVTGAFHLGDEKGRRAAIYFTDGHVYSATMAGYDPPIALRMHSAGLLDDAGYDTYAKVHPAEVGPKMIESGAANQAQIDAIHREVLFATIAHLFDWVDAAFHYVDGETTGTYVISPIPLTLTVSAVEERIGQWRALARAHPLCVQPGSIPSAGPEWANKVAGGITPETAALLTHVDGVASVAQISTACGFTRFEMAQLLSELVANGVLTVAAADARAMVPTVTQVAAEAPAVPAGFAPAGDLATARAEVEALRFLLAAAEARLAAAEAGQ